MSVGTWVVIETKSRQERWAAENVGRQGFRWYLPMTLSGPKPHRKPTPVCLFPRYLFAFTEGPWRSLRGTFGVIGLIMSGESPAEVPERTIESLRAREGSDGLIRLPNALEAPLIKPGTPVRVNGGAFQSYTGCFAESSGAERSKILIEFLGRRTKVLIANEDWTVV